MGRQDLPGLIPELSYEDGVVTVAWRLAEFGFAFSVGHLPTVQRCLSWR